jgi:hypothetical protein
MPDGEVRSNVTVVTGERSISLPPLGAAANFAS